MEEDAPTSSADSTGAAINSGAFSTGQTAAGDGPTADTGGMLTNDRDDCASMNDDDDAMSETGKSTCSYPFSSPNPSEQDDGTDHGTQQLPTAFLLCILGETGLTLRLMTSCSQLRRITKNA